MTCPTWAWLQDVVPLVPWKLIHKSLAGWPATSWCLHTPCDNFRQPPGQSTLPPLQPAAWQATIPLPLHAKQVFSPGPGPLPAGGTLGATAAVASGWEAAFAASDDAFFPQPAKSSVAKKQAQANVRAIDVRDGDESLIVVLAG